ncbi:nicotinate phosphoribosyltransferase [Amycolatopsis alkalitolerans]|uniref:Nicotinate phosphoribosyltransferase n=1 Tax=Amycolatopsis alkalitolerans TaxID=2547244 RepID=A0A5C4LTF9_9PSEU|nr:nicotinate phosphoribosyltransferase [Amycolatopsis alkalitolerans]TNC20477.1 nicotinate phosphoribosyltransferase [Amycolatopsis alkalitolerans]
MTALHTDLYEIRMAASYLRRGMTEPAVFSLFARRLPRHRGFLVAAGLAEALDFLAGFAFDHEELAYLRQVVGLPQSDVDELAGMRFTGEAWAVPEGTVVHADEPLLEITAPLPQAQLIETAMLNFLTFGTTVASKAVRCRLAAGGADLVDFAARRTQGTDAAFTVARLTALAGFSGTSHVASALRYGLRPVGTMAHSYVQAFGDERSAFEAFAEDFPVAPVFLVDTYDTIAGVEQAIEVARRAGLPAERVGIRLDSGDLLELSRRARVLLDEAGLTGARIMASGSLDEYALAELTAAGAPIDSYGVGTKVGVSADAPYLDSAYKLVEYAGRPVMKLSPGKATLPGAKQVYRGADGDVLALRDEEPPPGHRPLLEPVLRAGRRVPGRHTPADARERLEHDLAALPPGARRLREPDRTQVRLSAALTGLAARTRLAHPVRH